jgi:hypothetical protein
MFQLDLDAIREAAIESWLTANLANPAELTGSEHPRTPSRRKMVSGVATLAVSQSENRLTDPVVIALLEAAMRACDHWGDCPAARAEMLADLRALPQGQRQGWLEYFLAVYGKAKG